MDTCESIKLPELLDIISNGLSRCNDVQLVTWKKYSVEPFKAKINRYGLTESVYIVAINSHEAMYYEDVEDGFNFSNLGTGKYYIVEEYMETQPQYNC